MPKTVSENNVMFTVNLLVSLVRVDTLLLENSMIAFFKEHLHAAQLKDKPMML